MWPVTPKISWISTRPPRRASRGALRQAWKLKPSRGLVRRTVSPISGAEHLERPLSGQIGAGAGVPGGVLVVEAVAGVLIDVDRDVGVGRLHRRLDRVGRDSGIQAAEVDDGRALRLQLGVGLDHAAVIAGRSRKPIELAGGEPREGA